MFYETYWYITEYRIIRNIRVYAFIINLIKHGSIVTNLMHGTITNYDIVMFRTFNTRG
jgi:hypothetical protein